MTGRKKPEKTTTQPPSLPGSPAQGGAPRPADELSAAERRGAATEPAADFDGKTMVRRPDEDDDLSKLDAKTMVKRAEDLGPASAANLDAATRIQSTDATEPEGELRARDAKTAPGPQASPSDGGVGGGTRPLGIRSVEPVHCGGCGTAVEPSWRFCKSCGTPTGLASAEASAEDATGQDLRRVRAPRHVLHRLKADGVSVKESHELTPGLTSMGRCAGDVQIPEDGAMSARHASFEVDGESCVLRDMNSTNGSFVALRRSEPLQPGAVLLLGSQRLLFRTRRDSAGLRREELVQVLPLGHEGRVFELVRDNVVLGKGRRADFSFPEDGFLSRQHAEVVRTNHGLVVRDLGSTNRTYLIVTEDRPLLDGDRIVLGEQLFEYRKD